MPSTGAALAKRAAEKAPLVENWQDDEFTDEANQAATMKLLAALKQHHPEGDSGARV